MAAAEAFFGAPLASEVVEYAFSQVRVPGRIELVPGSPVVVLDGAHNVAGVEALAQALSDELTPDGEIVAVMGMLAGRDPSAMVEALRPAGVQTVVTCTAPSPRAVPAEVIAEAARAAGFTALATDDIGDALTLARARAGDGGLVVVMGSLYVVAEARSQLVGSDDPADEQREAGDEWRQVSG